MPMRKNRKPKTTPAKEALARLKAAEKDPLGPTPESFDKNTPITVTPEPLARVCSFRVFANGAPLAPQSMRWRDEPDGTRTLVLRRGVREDVFAQPLYRMCLPIDSARLAGYGSARITIEILTKTPATFKGLEDHDMVLRTYVVRAKRVVDLGPECLDHLSSAHLIEAVELRDAQIVES